MHSDVAVQAAIPTNVPSTAEATVQAVPATAVATVHLVQATVQAEPPVQEGLPQHAGQAVAQQ